MAQADSDPWADLSNRQPPPLPPPPPFEVATFLDGSRQVSDPRAMPGLNSRRHPREQAPPCRPIKVRHSLTVGFTADILDISLGGLCLLITDGQELNVGQALELDFGGHRMPEPMQHRGPVQARLRWYVRSGPVTTLGVGFDSPLPELPELL